MAGHGGSRHGMAYRLFPWRGLEVVVIPWLGGCRHGSEVVGMAWLMLLPWRGV